MEEIITMIKDNDPKGIEELEIFYKKLEATKEFISKTSKERMNEYNKTKEASDFSASLAYKNVAEMLENLMKGN